MVDNYKEKLWGGRFRKGEDQRMEEFQNGFQKTLWLLEWDILGSIAHGKMLTKCGIIDRKEGEKILEGLEELLREYRNGELSTEEDYEDVHTFVELKLAEKIGNSAKRLHTARSRNDQCNTDMKLFVRHTAGEVKEKVQGLIDVLREKGENNPVIMPGYTHLQRAQTVTFKHYLGAYESMLKRDHRRLCDFLESMRESPLGCGALAGTTHSIDRQYTADLLGFPDVYENFLDGVSDRDYVLEGIFIYSLIMMHLSRLSEEICLFASSEFDFIELDDRYTTGSSIMPQKKNPDGAELIRGKTGRVYGHLTALLTVMKGLPLAYNKDMQEDKESYYDSYLTVSASLEIMGRMVDTLSVHGDQMAQGVRKGYLNATDVADYLVKKGMAFRTAHGVVGELVLYGEDRGRAIEDLTLEELQKFSDLFEEDIFQYIDYEEALKKGIKKEML